MSTDIRTADGVDRTGTVACGLCGAPMDQGGRFLACYPTEDGTAPAQTAEDGLLALCGSCADEVRELTVAWDEVGPPAVADGGTIAESYQRAATACSFCDGDHTGATLGIESWSPGHPARLEPDDLAHFAICESCGSIFEEFLDGVRADV